MKFFKLRKQIKVQKEPYSLSDYLHDHECMYIGTDGFRLYRAASYEELLEHYAADIDRLLLLSGFCKDDFDEAVKPVIQRFIRKVGVVPASELHHDADSGGLIRHSLNVACQALKMAKELMLFEELSSSLAIKAALIVLSLAHDLGKILTDFEVYSLDRLHKWQSGSEDLDDFCRRHALSYISLHFISGRHHQHQRLMAASLDILVKASDKIFSLINAELDFYRLKEALEGRLADIVLKADAQAVKLYGSAAQNILYVPDFIRSKLICDICSGDKSINRINSDIFLTSFGVILECGSETFSLFKSFYESAVLGRRADVFNFEKQSFTQQLRSLGVFSAFGTKRVYNYYRIQLDDDLLYVKGALIALEDLKRYGECVNAVMLGSRMVGLLEAVSEIRQLEIDKIVHIRVKNGAHLNEITVDNLDLNSIRCYDSILNQDFEPYEKEFIQERCKEAAKDKLACRQSSAGKEADSSGTFKLGADCEDMEEILKFDLYDKHNFQGSYYPKCLLNQAAADAKI